MLHKYKADIILLAAVVLFGAVLALTLWLNQSQGSVVQIRIDGKVTASLPLDRDTEYEINGADGGRNLLVISGGAAWVESADCPDELCVGMGKISRVGQSVVCLPHKVVVEITGGSAEVDVTAG